MLNLLKRKGQEVEITVSTATVMRIMGVIVLSLVLLLAIRKAQHALTLIFVAVFMTLALNAPVHWLAMHFPGRRKGNRTLATALAYFVIIGLLAAFIASLVPPLVRQTATFVDAAPGLVDSVRDEDSSVGRLISRYHLENEVNDFSNQLGSRLRNASGPAVGTVTRVGSSIFSTLTVLVLTFMMLIEGPRWLLFARRLMPKEKQDHANKLAMDMYKVIKGYVNGQVLLAALAALLISIPLFALHISYPIALMVIIFICGLIPMFGHTIGAIIVSTVALFHSPVSAVIILAYYITYQQLENYIVQPKIQANSTDMSPLLVFVSVIIGVSFNGLLGGLVAIPVAGCLRIIVLDYLKSRRYLSPEEEPGGTTIVAS